MRGSTFSSESDGVLEQKEGNIRSEYSMRGVFYTIRTDKPTKRNTSHRGPQEWVGSARG